MTFSQVVSSEPTRADIVQPQVMGIVNVTPDSFSDGRATQVIDHAIAHAKTLIDQGADILDIGGESTRPGALPVSVEEELRRVIPVIRAVAQLTTRPISIDTSKPKVMEAAVLAGASMINDVSALRAPGALAMAVRLNVRVVLMHMQGEPGTMQRAPSYTDVVHDVLQFLAQRLAAAQHAGLALSQLIIDPGFGFGKTTAHNMALLSGLHRFRALGTPVLVGLSRKRSLGELIGQEDPGKRVYASVAAHLLAVQRGAAIVRVHDVSATQDALRIWNAVQAIDHVSQPLVAQHQNER